MRDARHENVMLIPEFSRAGGISRMTGYVMARAGEIPAVWRRGRYELKRSDVPRILAKLRREGRIPATEREGARVA